MTNPLIAELAKLLAAYGSDLPPLEERRLLWAAIAGTSDANIRRELDAYIDDNETIIHTTLLGEISKILHD